MAVWALGINHTTAPLDLRGRFAFAIDQIAPTLQGLRESLSRHPEAAIISTCNRTEIYCAGDKLELDPTLEWLAHSGGVSSSLLRSHTYTLEDGHAARHARSPPKRARRLRRTRTRSRAESREALGSVRA